MAKYKLIVTHYLEDNEEMQSASEMSKYMEHVVTTGIGDWDEVKATLVANDTSVVHSETSGGLRVRVGSGKPGSETHSEPHPWH